MCSMKCRLIDILISPTPKPIGPNGVATGIYKKSIDRRIMIKKLGLEGDIQVDKRVHGGLEKAIYQYPFENYKKLKEYFPQLSDNFNTPSVGENFSTVGLSENDVHIGDTFVLGETLLQVSQPRMPCWKLNHKIGNAYVSSVLINESITGWYYRVISEGSINTNDELILQERQAGSISITDLWKIWKDPLTRKDIEKMNIPGLSNEWYSIS
ncbi:6-N-hydroxylaminopurine resistance protein [Vibrio thalassae]|uniref:6-N-hydroxylaminopurine resistance protein n=1 Tax=Vibrio thalassae TaxID=1243014 RepID=A0A240EM04_9VIBR|nr:MOSC domain-containing protein [Vibrio thalassae]SNX49654.1 6-N-hydroxylaminopurine resistance protein [Vibrio thalassae]